jgi:hypothetical protein
MFTITKLNAKMDRDVIIFQGGEEEFARHNKNNKQLKTIIEKKM